MSQLWAEGMAGLRRSAEKRGIIEIDTRSDKEKEKEKKKKLAEKVKKQKQKEREAKKARIKRKLVWKARKKAAIAMVAKVGECQFKTFFISNNRFLQQSIQP